MSIASIGRKLLTACKYAALAIFAALWCWFTAIFGSFIGKGIGGSLFAENTGAAIGALVGLVVFIGLLQLEASEQKTNEDS
ncbi:MULTISPECIES: hypothetical protein [Bradyrhizobium]|jgi:hypothetical protein|uniref:hypothetical protein n=1 Tax=Bradyrhizobium TaxID=374 RepID=UPI001FFB8DBA|nr:MULTISPECIES: hypothetical protein [Bradyrhizobium]MCK1463472.1 hypothetical protein [Bradyrhizobium sp. 2]MCS3931916.1 VIT1/CCC1 family predicted Fe2+/Mn2+ transporter [Bradyrhizobium elkanii]MCS3972474.1 VIT1/CCC1 family predicted Fe2+/Mn2+ transporter [Bradyrhizobium japonicum]